jgi:hypothetical protein
MTEILIVRVIEICNISGLSEADIWDKFVDARLDLRLKYKGEKCVEKAIEQVAQELSLEKTEAKALYSFLRRKFMD